MRLSRSARMPDYNVILVTHTHIRTHNHIKRISDSALFKYEEWPVLFAGEKADTLHFDAG